MTVTKHIQSALTILSLTSLLSCNDTPENVQLALAQAGEHRTELERVIEHYSHDAADSLKLKAAYFLIGNMEGYHYYQGETLDRYHDFFDTAIALHTKWPGMDINPLGDSLRDVYGPATTGNVKILPDLQTIRGEYLINNIDHAYKAWQEQPWCKHVTFDQFCEFILPYRIENEDPYAFDRNTIYDQFDTLLNPVRRNGGGAMAACLTINQELKKGMWVFTNALESLPHFGAKTILEKRVGVCREYADLALYTMRATGIPVAIDFTPQWPFRSLGHSWNVLLAENGKKIMFLGIESDPGQPHKADHKKAKVYRNTFAIQPQSLAKTAGDTDIPPLFRNARFIDVSDEYFEGKDVEIELDNVEEQDTYAYICVFDNRNWVPIHWGKITDGKVVFTKMGRDIVYLPAYYRKGKIVPAASPFLLTNEGEVKTLDVSPGERQQMTLLRKFPILTIRERMVRVAGGKFQGANRPDFKDSTTLFTISRPDIFYQTVDISTEKKFRYLRYLAPRKSNGNIAEIEFYSATDSLHPLKGEIIGDAEVCGPANGRETAMDGDVLTFYDARKIDNAWVGIDIGAARRINKIRYLATNDGNNIVPGDDYELFYFKDKGWRSAGRQVATDYALIFDRVPSGGLYLLRNYTEGKEERIFTYKNGQQVWW
ncbi:transglutaminase-like domain-containing protein [Dawidia soli]|uniref:Transglutaminase-like domain-containing protein n=1 Tax=Dawidia soli TaxID=2782352 RepID=A0AAP2DEK1_9BACT|nr:transglutaminase-like domain-containing protein [Dawidia soli]MBT1689837.1 transglutaminase-like domain-containing protein [Dawidia soli]